MKTYLHPIALVSFLVASGPMVAQANDGMAPEIFDLVQNGPNVEITLEIWDPGDPGLHWRWSLDRVTGDESTAVFEDVRFTPEDADEVGEAVPIPSGTLEGLMLCAFDPDHFSLFLRDGASLDVLVEYANTAAPVSAALYSPGRSLLSQAGGVSGRAEISLGAASETGWFTLAVSAEEEWETTYRLVLSLSCVDDRMEPNGDAPTAPELRDGLEADLQLCRGGCWLFRGQGLNPCFLPEAEQVYQEISYALYPQAAEGKSQVLPG